MAKNLIEKIENSPISFWQIIFLIYLASFLRGFLEVFVNSDNQYHLIGIIDTFFHYPLWYFGVILFIFILLKILTKEKIEKISRLGAIFSFLIIIGPIIDFIINQTNSVRYTFIISSPSGLLQSFLTFFGEVEMGTLGVSLGLKIEILLVLISIGYYIFLKTKKLIKVTIGIFLSYVIIFSFFILPVFIFEAQNIISGDNQLINHKNINHFYCNDEIDDTITNHRTFILDRNNFESPKIQNIKNQYSITISLSLLIINIFLLVWWFYLYSKRKFIATIKNFRYLRIIHYYLLIVFGTVLGFMFVERWPIGSTFDLLSFVAVFLSLLFAWLFSVWENDEADIEIDKISNPGRPLAKGEFLIEEWRALKYLFLFLSLAFAFLTGLYAFIFILMFIAVYHIYSAPPFRLKKFPGISSLLIAINALLAVWLGFFITAGTEKFNVFPLKYSFAILIVFFLAENVKNLKDIEGDRKNGIKTLPVILGEKLGKLIIGILIFLASLLVPTVFLLNIYTFFTAIFFGSVLFLLTNKKEFKEKYIYLVYYLFAIVFVFEFLYFT